MFDLLDLMNLLPDETSEEYQEQLKVVNAYANRLKKGFSKSFLNDFWDAESRLVELSCNKYFLAGLRLGAQITFALLLPQPKTPHP